MKKTSVIAWCLFFMFMLLMSCADDSTSPDQVANPVFSPASGTYEDGQEVSITCATANAEIRYTTDGSDPTAQSTLYTVPLIIPDIFLGRATTGTIKARAFKEGMDSSAMAQATYTVETLPVPDDFVIVAGGTFSNGVSEVTLSSFYIDKYELTQEHYQAIMGENPSQYNDNPQRPVEKVSWFDAIEYCNRRSIQEDLSPCYSYLSNGTDPANWPSGWNGNAANHANIQCNWLVTGYRLPTEMEWMFAAKGGTLSQGYTYSGSNDLSAVAWHYGDASALGPKPVGTKAANELGIYDMSGNVYEMVWDIWGDYSSDPQTNPHGASSGMHRIIRGGSWFSNTNYCEITWRDINGADATNNLMGFRVVRKSN